MGGGIGRMGRIDGIGSGAPASGRGVSVSSRRGWGPAASARAPAATRSRGHGNPRLRVSVSSRWGWGPAASARAPAATRSRGHGNPRLRVSVSSRWGWGPGASARKMGSRALDARTYPERPIVGVGAIIVENDRVLLVRRGHEPLKGEWSLPGGAVEVGETLRAAVVREVLEETGLDVDVGPVVEVLDRIRLDPDGRARDHYVLIDYLCRPIGGTLACASDAEQAVWAAFDELAAYRVAETAIAVIRKAFDLPHPSP